ELMNHDRCRTHAFALHEAEQDRGIGGIEPNAAVRGGAAEMRKLVTAVDSETAKKEKRMRRPRIIKFSRETRTRQDFRGISAGRGDVAAPRGGDAPAVTRYAVDGYGHALNGTIDVDDDGGASASRQRDSEYQLGQNAAQKTHHRPRRPQHLITT